MRQEIIDLYDAFTHGTMGRRAFMDRLARIAGGAAAATALLPLLENNYAHAAIVPANDKRLSISTATFDDVTAYHAKPKAESILPAIIVIHENRGLNPHIEDVARRQVAARPVVPEGDAAGLPLEAHGELGPHQVLLVSTPDPHQGPTRSAPGETTW